MEFGGRNIKKTFVSYVSARGLIATTFKEGRNQASQSTNDLMNRYFSKDEVQMNSQHEKSSQYY